jgi:hypothetical protein
MMIIVATLIYYKLNWILKPDCEQLYLLKKVYNIGS